MYTYCTIQKCVCYNVLPNQCILRTEVAPILLLVTKFARICAFVFNLTKLALNGVVKYRRFEKNGVFKVLEKLPAKQPPSTKDSI